MKKKIATIGIHPDFVDYSQYPGMTKEGLSKGLEAQKETLQNMGFEVEMLLTDLGETAEDTTKQALAGKNFDAILIGAGVRVPPPCFLLFEKLINVVHECAPKAKICFNTKPEDTAEAFRRWLKA